LEAAVAHRDGRRAHAREHLAEVRAYRGLAELAEDQRSATVDEPGGEAVDGLAAQLEPAGRSVRGAQGATERHQKVVEPLTTVLTHRCGSSGE
jgi:hypothetical protein